MSEWDFDFGIEKEEQEEWFCADCNMGPIDEKKTKCPRCGYKLKSHWEQDVELDENGEPLDEEYYHEHY